MRRTLLALLGLALIAGGCSGDSQSIDDACSRVVHAQQVAQRNLAGSPGEAQFATVTEALHEAHVAVMGLSTRDSRRLTRNCAAVSGVERATFRSLEYPAVAANLRAVEEQLAETVRSVQFARRQLSREIEFACEALEKADDAQARGAVARLADLDRAVVLLESGWNVDQRMEFIAACGVDLDRDWSVVREALVLAAAAEQSAIAEREAQREVEQQAAEQRRAEVQARRESEASQRAAEEMLAVLVQMEMAWNSISRSDQATVCALFRDDRVGTSQQWVRLSGYGKYEYAFVFLSEACR